MIELQVSGMSCGHCVKAVTQAIQQRLPTASVEITLATGRVNVANVSPTPEVIAQLSTAIRDEGYEVIGSSAGSVPR